MGSLRRRTTALSALALACATGLTTVTSPVGAAVLGCGDIISQSTVLENDVGPCNIGLIVGADNVTLDLGGHTVSGRPGTGDGAGIYLLRRTGVTVKNGTVRDFDGGVVIDGGTGNTVTGITAVDNIGIVGATRYAEGIAILSSTNNIIDGNVVRHNGPLGGIGVYSRLGDHPRPTSGLSTGNLITRNQVHDNNVPRNAGLNDSDGIRIESDSAFNTITFNQVSGSGLDGIALFSFSPDNVVKFNTVWNNGFLNPFTRKGDGIRVFGGSHRSHIEGNRVFGNAANGIVLHGVFNTRPPVLDSKVLDNVAFNNNRLPPLGPGPLGGPTFDLNDGNPDCDNNLWRRNTYRTANPVCTTIEGRQI